MGIESKIYSLISLLCYWTKSIWNHHGWWLSVGMTSIRILKLKFWYKINMVQCQLHHSMINNLILQDIWFSMSSDANLMKVLKEEELMPADFLTPRLFMYSLATLPRIWNWSHSSWYGSGYSCFRQLSSKRASSWSPSGLCRSPSWIWSLWSLSGGTVSNFSSSVQWK